MTGWLRTATTSVTSPSHTCLFTFHSHILGILSPLLVALFPLKVRVIGCDFDSYLSQWGGSCPTQSFEHQSLEERSEDMLKKLQAAGVGQRPTVFVGHSMGGLIIKKMLVNAQNSDDEERKKFAENTKGVVFYSTPHKGSEIANLNMITKYFFSPSVEVQELNTDYPLLLELNNYFKGFVEKFKTKVTRKRLLKLAL